MPPKGECHLFLNDLQSEAFAHGQGQIVVVVSSPSRRAFGSPQDEDYKKPHPEEPQSGVSKDEGAILQLKKRFKKRLYIAVSKEFSGNDVRRMHEFLALSAETGIPLVAVGDVRYHTPARRPLADVMLCIREGLTMTEAGLRLSAHAERYPKPIAEIERLFTDMPDAVVNAAKIADACTFNLDELCYEYPIDATPDGLSPQAWLEKLTWQGAAARYSGGVPGRVREQLLHELKAIAELNFAPYFLTVYDIVRFARSRDILCQGRGSAANSAVCYVLGITAVDPDRIDVLFERFISAERGEPPDIDVDFESGRREEVIQYVYEKYGRARAGMTATVITYRTKGAVREVGKVMGLTDDVITAMQSAAWRRSFDEVEAQHLCEAGVDPTAHEVRMTMALAAEIRGFPRHLSQHTGGMVITKSPLLNVVPIANAAMEDRTVIEWDKDDLDTLGILKIDILGLGMLTAIHKSFDLIRAHLGTHYTLANVPPEDPAVYDMLCKADSVGVFQVESRAQMSMLPRLRPRCFYDLVIEVAIVRPGPIQGDMVHPYLRRRQGLEAVDFPSDALRGVLGKTLGIPLFQEQAMKVAIVGAGFTPNEADQLRRALATFRRLGDIAQFQRRFVDGMLNNGYDPDFAERCFKQIEGFADYGFPESHAASFALLVYVSSWLKRHHPAVFTCALLNSQPMGFYAPAQLVRDARNHGVQVLPVCVNASAWDCTLEDPPHGGNTKKLALRLGFRQVKGLKETDMTALVEAREAGGYANVEDVHRRSGLKKSVLERLARADAFQRFGLKRRDALWAVKGLEDGDLPLFAAADKLKNEPAAQLPDMSTGEHVADDYRVLRLSLRAHPVSLLRGDLLEQGFVPQNVVTGAKHGLAVKVAGLVTARQRPGSAKGVLFLTMEDEAAVSNLIVWPDVFEAFRRPLIQASLLGVQGRVQREGDVIHVLVEKAWDLTPWLKRLDEDQGIRVKSRNFH